MPPLKKILLVDDDNVLRSLTKTALERSEKGFEIMACSSAAEAMSGLDVFVPDLLLTDYVMPMMDGIELIQEIEKRGHSVPAILITGKADGSLNEQICGLSSLIGIIGKPFPPRALGEDILNKWNLFHEER